MQLHLLGVGMDSPVCSDKPLTICWKEQSFRGSPLFFSQVLEFPWREAGLLLDSSDCQSLRD